MPVYSQTSRRRQRLSQTYVPETTTAAPSSDSTPEYRSDVQLLDVTQRDIRCVIDANPGIGDTVSFDVEHADGSLSSVSGLVHWKQISRNGYEVGLCMPAGLPDGMTALISDRRRRSNRYRCRQSGQLYRPDLGQRSEATLVDYNFDGVSIQVANFCNVDETVTFEWSGDHGAQQISCQVLWQIERQQGVVLGCQTDPGAGYRISGLPV